MTTENQVSSDAVLDILERMRELVLIPDRWIQRDWAQTAQGGSVSYRSFDACKFCLEGAVQRACYDYLVDAGVNPTPEPVWEIAGHLWDTTERTLTKYLTPVNDHVVPTLINFNDSRYTTHRQVLDLLDRAIQDTKEAVGRDTQTTHPT